jgi:hypothetical protein
VAADGKRRGGDADHGAAPRDPEQCRVEGNPSMSDDHERASARNTHDIPRSRDKLAQRTMDVGHW